MMYLWTSYKKKMWKNFFLHPQSQWRKDSDPDMDPDPHQNVGSSKLVPTHKLTPRFTPQSIHRVATATFWRTFHRDGKISPGCWRWGVHSHCVALDYYQLPAHWKLIQLIQWLPGPSPGLPAAWDRPAATEPGSKKVRTRSSFFS